MMPDIELPPAMRRRSVQPLPPMVHAPTAPGAYDIYPAFPAGPGIIGAGHGSLAERIAGLPSVAIDGYVGVFWDILRGELTTALEAAGHAPTWIDVSEALRPADEIERLVAPFLGGDDPLWGTRFTGTLADFFDPEKLAALAGRAAEGPTIFHGVGASLVPVDRHLIYVDLPKNEIQYRSRAGSIANLGRDAGAPPKEMYKRFYFVDWVALNRRKEEILPVIDTIVDGQHPEDPRWMDGGDLRSTLARMSRSWFRVRPWFEPGPWGGRWIKEHIQQVSPEPANYAWSFEMIAPENGLMLESDGRLLEVSFDLLMYAESASVLGAAAPRFGAEFPIRFDFLDTYSGGNLSVQCHPRPEYIRREFGESFTQDETYYILDCEPGASVYLGFREDIDPERFRAELERSFREGTPVAIEEFVNVEPAEKHGLYLIPNGTIHCSGVNNLVLEISATPYIFTFKMYDWMRLDLDGTPRPLNIRRAFENLYFDRKGASVRAELVSHPRTIAEGSDWRIVHLPTHPEHFYDVHRYELATSVEGNTRENGQAGACHVMSLVEGSSVLLETADGARQRFNYAETFVVPAAAGRYRIINEGTGRAMVVKAFVKPDHAVKG